MQLNRAALGVQQHEIWNSLIGYGTYDAICKDDDRVLYCSQPQGGAQRRLCISYILLLLHIRGNRDTRSMLAI